jgi:hypothetical protein
MERSTVQILAGRGLSGWREVADTTLAFVERFVKH